MLASKPCFLHSVLFSTHIIILYKVYIYSGKHPSKIGTEPAHEKAVLFFLLSRNLNAEFCCSGADFSRSQKAPSAGTIRAPDCSIRAPNLKFPGCMFLSHFQRNNLVFLPEEEYLEV